MKKLISYLPFTLFTCSCFSQTAIDTSAMLMLQKSWDKLNAMKIITYKGISIDTMIRPNHFSVNRYSVQSTVKKDAYWYLHHDNNSAWLVRGDTLYKKERYDSPFTSSTTKWKSHEMGGCNIYNILGSKRPKLNNDITSLKFINDTSANAFYVVEEKLAVDNKVNLAHYYRYFIDKKSLFASRRIKYGKYIHDGDESVDIYDFSASLDTTKNLYNPSSFFTNAPVEEKDRFEALKNGTTAPAFTAKDVKTGKAVSLAALKGKVVVLDFWYLSCSPCRELMPKLQKLHEKFKGEDVVIIGINISDNDPKKIAHYANGKHFTYRQYYHPNQLLKWDYKMDAFPTTFVIGRDGKIKMTETGLAEDTEHKMEVVIKKELAVKVTSVVKNLNSGK